MAQHNRCYGGWIARRAASNSNDIQIVYVADSPRLKAVWRWRARARTRVRSSTTLLIQNLGSEQIWLPLQPSLRFDWTIDPKAALQRFWIEKGADIPSPEGTHLDALLEGDTWQGTSSPYAIPKPGSACEK